jgi:hypothetical protein
MGRNPKYKNDDERRLAANASAQKYYDAHKDKVLMRSRVKRALKKLLEKEQTK